MEYFIADPHLSHSNIIKLCGRPFGSVEEMDEAIIYNWNREVSNNDSVYIVGDLMLGGNSEYYLSRLSGKNI